jgi:hypothetical protein
MLELYDDNSQNGVLSVPLTLKVGGRTLAPHFSLSPS